MKKILFLSLLTLTFACSSNNNGASNPNNTAKEFENPTGELTSTNAKSIVNAAIAGNSILILRTPNEIFSIEGLEYEDCTETSGDTKTIDWDCVFNNITQCDATGDTVSTNDSDDDFKSVDYNQLEVICNENDPDEVSVEVDGDLNVARSDNLVFCADITYSVDDNTKTFNGCRNEAGSFSVRLDDKNFVIVLTSIDDGCSELTTTVRDKDGTKDVVCAIEQTDGSCDGTGNIQTVANCEIQ